MEQKITDILKNQFDRLPESLRNFIISDDIKEKFKKIGEKYILDDKKQTALENETMMILMGLESLSDYEKNLISEASLSKDQAESIALDVTENIILSISEDLGAFLEKELEEESVETKQAIGGAGEEQVKEVRAKTPLQAPAEAAPVEFKKVAQKEVAGGESVQKTSETESVRKLLRENSKTVNIKNLIANIK